MKKILFSVLMLLCASSVLSAQDIITKRNGEDIKAKILEVNLNEIKYRKWDYLEGPIFSIAKHDVLIVRYENGTNDIFNTSPYMNGNISSDTPVPAELKPGMKYREYKKFYSPSEWSHQPGDRHSPAVGGICSWLIPGLGQMICGEVGRGFGWLGGAIGCCVVISTGSLLSAGAAASYSSGRTSYQSANALFITGSVLTIVGSAGLLAVDICAIVDGVRVAKIKNMYERDVRQLSSLSVDLQPYFAAVPGNSSVPVAGASLRIRF